MRPCPRQKYGESFVYAGKVACCEIVPPSEVSPPSEVWRPIYKKKLVSILGLISHWTTDALLLKVYLIRDSSHLFDILAPYWVPIYFSGSLFAMFWLHSHEIISLGSQLGPYFIKKGILLGPYFIKIWVPIPMPTGP